jgi:hypothetical protein
MPFTINCEINYVPLPPEKELAWRSALLWLMEIIQEIDDDDVDHDTDEVLIHSCDLPVIPVDLGNEMAVVPLHSGSIEVSVGDNYDAHV